MKQGIFKLTLAIVLPILVGLFWAVPSHASTLSNELEKEIVMTKDELAVQRVAKMPSDEVLSLYEDYLEKTSYTGSLNRDLSAKSLAGFADYAVKAGIIDNTVTQKGALTKAVIRAEFKLVVAGGNLCGYKTAATLLDHSLQDNPSALSYGSSSSMATQITSSSEYKSIISDFKSKVAGSKATYKEYSGSTTLNSTTDLHLAYNKVSYTVVGRKSNNQWTVTVTFKDTYDFEKQAWTNAMTDNKLVTLLNNYAASAQSLGAIVPYSVTVTTQTKY